MVEAETMMWAIVTGLAARSHDGSADPARRIVRRLALTPATFLWEVHAPDVAAVAQP